MLMAVLAACGVQSPEPTPDGPEPVATDEPVPVDTPTPEMERALAPVESLEVAIERNEVVVVASGNLRDGCTEIDIIETTQEGNTLRATITTVRDPLALCTEALVPYQEIIRFERNGLEPGVYTVEVNDATTTVSILGDDATLSAALDGQAATVSGSGLPADASIPLGVGPLNAEYDTFTEVETDADGAFETVVDLPEQLTPGEQYVFVANVDGQELLSEPFEAPEPGADGSNAMLYLVALDDGGERGELIGCGDSLVPVEVSLDQQAGQQPLAGIIERLLVASGEDYGESGLYNALEQSTLSLVEATVTDEVAEIALEGELRLGGVCDNPRVEAQLTRTAEQLATVERVVVTINGEPLEDVLSLQGNNGTPPAPVSAARDWLVEQLGVATEEVTLVDFEAVEWSDSCLGLGGPAELCAAVITPGYRAVFRVDSMNYEVRTDESGDMIRSPQFR